MPHNQSDKNDKEHTEIWIDILRNIVCFSFNFQMFSELLEYCNIHNLINFFRIGIIRAYLQSTLVCFLTLSAFYASLEINQGAKLISENSSVTIITIPAILSILFMVLFICTLFCVCYVLSITTNIHKYTKTLYSSDDETKKNTKDTVEAYQKFENKILMILKIWHVLGVIGYIAVGVVSAILLTLIYEDRDLTYLFPTFLLIGFVMGLSWNMSDYLADKNIDWGYILKDVTPIFQRSIPSISPVANKGELDTEADKLNNLKEAKFKTYKLHTIVLGGVSLFNILAATICFAFGATTFEIGMDLFSNAYIIFFASICYLFYKSCYTSYYKNENNANLKIYPHLTDYKISYSKQNLSDKSEKSNILDFSSNQ